ncbi:MAG: SDR family NAD(P)-dependent oxidoreductase, partial [Rubrivivax sp.]
GMEVDATTRQQMKQHTGMQPLPTQDGLQALAQAWASGHDQVMVLHGRLARLRKAFVHCAPGAAGVQPQASAPAPAMAVPSEDILHDRTVTHLKRLLSSALDLAVSRIDADAAMEIYGIDSVMVMKLTSELEKTFGPLPKTLFFEYQTLRALAVHFQQAHRDVLAQLVGAPLLHLSDAGKGPAPGAPGRQAPLRRLSRLKPDAPQRMVDLGDIAIVGLAGRYPQARDVQEFWTNLSQGRNCITEIPAERWDHGLYFDADKDAPGKTYGKWGGFIDGVDRFDPLFFNIAPSAAERMEPQARLFLQCAYETLEDAGYDRRIAGGNVGVYVGVMYEEYQLYGAQETLQGRPMALGGLASSVANRVSYAFNFHGPSMALDTMCSSSLTALHLACQALQKGQCEAALVGGVNVSVHPNKYLLLGQGRFISSKGLCESFGQGGEGYVPAEGVGAVLLKPLAQAQRDGDHIYGVIKATAINHGGKTNGFSVPNPNAQAAVIEDTLRQAGVSARAVSYIEAHGTGTSLGDPIEIAGLSKAFGKHTDARQYCAIGSAKSNIGHAESAAGIAGLTKVLLQMKHGQLVPSLHSAELNPHIDFANSPFVVQQELAEWKRPVIEEGGLRKEYPRLAGLSSFGAGGSNAHVLIQEYVAPPRPAEQPGQAGQPALIVLSARNEERLAEQVQRLVQALQSRPGLELQDIAYTLQVGREAMEERLGVVATSVQELSEKLQAHLDGRSDVEDLYRGQVKRNKEALGSLNADGDMAQIVATWVAKGKHGQLLDLWVKGLDIDWSLTQGSQRARRVSLPTYPFAQERYWVPAVAQQPQPGPAARPTLHALLHDNTSDLAGQQYSSAFSGQESYLEDHQFQGARVLPAVVYLEMARAAAQHASGVDVGQAGAVQLRHVVWARPVVVGAQAVQVHIALQAQDDGAIQFEVYSQAAGQAEAGAPEQIHSQGSVELMEIPPAAAIDLAAVQAACTRTMSEQQVYEAFQGIGLQYGPAQRAVKELHIGPAQVLARLELPAAVQGTQDQYVLHPSVLDGALQAVIGLTREGGKPALPYALEELSVHGACADRMWAVVRQVSEQAGVRKLDIDVCDEQGRVSVALRGFSTRAVQAGGNAQADTTQADTPAATLLLQPRWQPLAAQPQTLPQYAGHEVLLCEVPQVQPEALQPLLGQARVEVLGTPGGDIAQRYQRHARSLFDRLQKILQGKPTAAVLVQVIVPTLGDAQVHAGLAGLLRTARQENPKLTGQLIAVEAGVSAQELARQLQDNAQEPWQQEIRYQDHQRLVRAWSELPQPGQAQEQAQDQAQEQAQPWKPQGVYLLTGGAGGLGALLAQEIARQAPGATLVMSGRSPLDAGKQALLDALQAQGARASYRELDVSDPHAVAGLVDAVLAEHGRLDGIVHGAGIKRDNYIIKKSGAEFEAVLQAKVAGLVNLDQASRQVPLSCFMALSSVAGAQGNAGQADYAAGNAFMDAYMAYRNTQVVLQQRSGRSLSVNWPLWEQGGMEVDATTRQQMKQHTGMQPLPTQDGLQALAQAWASGHDQVMVLHG